MSGYRVNLVYFSQDKAWLRMDNVWLRIVSWLTMVDDNS